MLAARPQKIALNLGFANDDGAGKTNCSFSRQNVPLLAGAPEVRVSNRSKPNRGVGQP
jgi:hypothetical protein